MSREKVKQVIKKILDNTGKTGKHAGSVSAAMAAVGYKPSYCKNPQDFTATKTYQECLKLYLPDEIITKRHNDEINATSIQHYAFPKMADKKVKVGKKTTIVENELTNEEIREIVESVPACRLIYIKRDFIGAWAFFQAPDFVAIDKAIDKAYKIKGYYAPEKIQLVKRKYQDLTDKDLAELEKTLKNYLLKK